VRVAPLLLVLALLSAGCMGRGGEEEPIQNATADERRGGTPSFALPDDRGVSAAANETNRTEEGVGGVEHKHDYWNGAETVVLLQRDVRLSALPFFPKGEGSMPAGVAYVKLPPGKLVYEGADTVRVLAANPTVRGLANPSPSAVTLQWLTAASSQWSQPVPLEYGTELVIPIEARETDMPHSEVSLWNFRILSERPPTFESLNLTITVTRGRDVVDWPGHPEFYAETTERIVFDGAVTTHQYGFPENAFYEGQDSWTKPTKLISYGTGLLDVYVNVTGFSSTPPMDPAGYFLYVHNATQLGYVCCEYQAYDDAHGNNDLVTYHFQVPVNATDMDGPYQPESRWGFRLVAAIGADVPSFGPVGFTDGATYDIDYTMRIIARKA